VISLFSLVHKKVSVVSFVLYGLFNIGVFVFYRLLTITMYSLIDKTNDFNSGSGLAFAPGATGHFGMPKKLQHQL
jgi:hypothetical protein